MSFRFSKYYFCVLLLSSCFFGPPTFKSPDNYLLTDSMLIVNTYKKEKIKSIRIYADTADMNYTKIILDTTFNPPTDEFKLPFTKDTLNKLYVDIYMVRTQKPDLSIHITPDGFVRKRKILFEGDKY
jgi:hypothetical protein